LEAENGQLRALLALPEGERPKIGSGPTGRGKSLKEGGVPMSERVRARKEARERERRAKGLPDVDTSDDEERNRDTETLSPRAASGAQSLPSLTASGSSSALPSLFPTPVQLGQSTTTQPFNFSFDMGQEASFPDFGVGVGGSMDTNSLFKPAPTPSTAFAGMFNGMFDPSPNNHQNQHDPPTHIPLSPPLTATHHNQGQPDLLTRLKACCHLSDSHVVNDPGLLIFATRLCQSFPCTFSGSHPDNAGGSDREHLLLDDAWRALKSTLDPGGEADGENRINTGRMAAELVIRAAQARGSSGGWIVCRFREGMSIKRGLVVGLVEGFGGKID
jgi:hypothetical protein